MPIKVTSCGCCAYKDEGRKDAFGHAYGCVCHNHMDIPSGIRPGKCEVHQEHRSSRMPEGMESVDPLFIHGVFNEFTPDEKALEEKLVERARKAGL